MDGERSTVDRVYTTRSANQAKLLPAGHLLDERFPSERAGAGRLSFVVGEPDRQPGARVLRGDAVPMSRETPLQVHGDSRVESPVGALKDVDQPEVSRPGHRGIIHRTPPTVTVTGRVTDPSGPTLEWTAAPTRSATEA